MLNASSYADGPWPELDRLKKWKIMNSKERKLDGSKDQN